MEFLFVSFRSVSIRLLVSFRVFTQAEIYAPVRATVFFFSRPRPNINRLRRPGAARAPPCISTELSNVNREKHKRKSHRFFPTESPSEHKYPSSYYTFNSLSLFWLDESRNANLRRSQIWRLDQHFLLPPTEFANAIPCPPKMSFLIWTLTTPPPPHQTLAYRE